MATNALQLCSFDATVRLPVELMGRISLKSARSNPISITAAGEDSKVVSKAKTGLAIFCFLAFLVYPNAAFSQSQKSDTDNFAEGRVAFDKYHDCSAALDALGRVSQEGRAEPLWVFYVAKVLDCLNNLPEALKYYKQYDQLVPNQPEIADAIADLNYRIGKKEAADRVQAADSQKRQEAEAARQAQRNNLSGDWLSESSSTIYVITGSGKGTICVKAKSPGPQSPYSIGQLVDCGEYDGTTLSFENWPVNWSDEVNDKWQNSSACEKPLPTDSKVTLRISEDGKTLSGNSQHFRANITDDDCTVSSYSTAMKWSRQ
jgi:hypothetical protein